MQGQYDDADEYGEDLSGEFEVEVADWTYTPRLEAPSFSDPWWRHVDYGGYNDCMHIDGGSVLPNCVGYAWGRFSELLTVKATLSRADAGQWFGYVSDGYERSIDKMAPRPGAVLCFGKYGGAGHVCIVEKVFRIETRDRTGTVTDFYYKLWTSDSGYNSGRFWVDQNRDSRSGYAHNSAYYFQGFIYNPAVIAESGRANTGWDQYIAEREMYEYDYGMQSQTMNTQYMAELSGGDGKWITVPNGYTGDGLSYPGNYDGLTGTAALLGYAQSRRDMFLRAAQLHVGQGNGWTCAVTGIPSNQAWCAAYIVACAKQASSLLNVIIPDTFSCGNLGRIGRMREMGQWFLGPALGGSISPFIGDIILFRKQHCSFAVNEYYADHAGIVISLYGNTVEVVEGDCDGVTQRNRYNITDGVISGLYRPDWKRVDISYQALPSYRKIQGLYTNSTSYKDAAVREVCYMNHGYQPSITPTNMKLSLLNYTGLLGDLYTVFGGVLTTSDSANNSDESTFIPTIANGGVMEGSLFLNSLGADTISNNISSTITSGNVTINASEAQATTFTFLVSHGLNAAAACGVLANIQCESGFRTNPGAGDGGTSFGLCQWHLGRGDSMRSFVGDDWETDLSGQLEYLWYELCNGYYDVLLILLNVSNDLDGAAVAADAFIRGFEKPAAVDQAAYFSDGRPNGGSSAYRQLVAQSFYLNVVTQDQRNMSTPDTNTLEQSINQEYLDDTGKKKTTTTKKKKTTTKSNSIISNNTIPVIK